jgi:transketolase
MPQTLSAHTVRGLAIDAVQAADSGHPGMPLGMADVATVLWQRFLTHDPADPAWPDRDRFVLSAGHGSALLYALLHLAGYDLGLDDLRAFRQWGSRTPGHPEVGHTPGVETTTGPLGQGVANAVGMALAERLLRETFGTDLCDHRVWCIAGDGCLMEGVAAEAVSLAGHLGLDRLCVLYDSNAITIDGSTALAFTEDVPARFAAAGWRVLSCDGHDPDDIAHALSAARNTAGQPTLVVCRTTIGFASAVAGSEKSHGSPLGPADVAATKARLGLDPERHFQVPDGVTDAFRAHDGPERRAAWRARLDGHPDRERFLAWLAADGEAAGAAASWPAWADGARVATRKASQAVLKALVVAAPWIIGGSADLAGSNGTGVGARALTRERFGGGGTIHFGVREHAMASIANGAALHGGVLPYVATFLVFHDYMRPAVRLSALMGQRVVYVYTHDSVFLGEDGPTHQPVETLLALRAIPGVHVYRPADARETASAWKAALARRDGPTALILTRQDLPVLPGTAGREAAAIAGGYAVLEPDRAPDVVLLATGSEVATAVDAAGLLATSGVAARVLSLPCRERFWTSPARAALLPAGVPRVSIEAAVTLGWERYVGDGGLSIGIDTFGHSAPAERIAAELGFTPEAVAARVRAHLGR